MKKLILLSLAGCFISLSGCVVLGVLGFFGSLSSGPDFEGYLMDDGGKWNIVSAHHRIKNGSGQWATYSTDTVYYNFGTFYFSSVEEEPSGYHKGNYLWAIDTIPAFTYDVYREGESMPVLRIYQKDANGNLLQQQHYTLSLARNDSLECQYASGSGYETIDFIMVRKK